MKKLRIMWHGVPSGYPTGYGTQTNLFTPALRDLGHEVAISSIIPCTHGPDGNGILMYQPGVRHTSGNDFIQGHMNDFKADLVISCIDTHIMDPKKFSKLWWVAWQVVDSAPLAPELAKVAGSARTRISMSKWGQGVLDDAGYSSEYCPLAFSRKDFYRDQLASREAFAAMLKADELDKDTFLVVMTSANMSNPSRKNFYAAFAGFEAARQELASRGIKAIMYCHTEPTGIHHGGEDLCTIAESLKIPRKSLFFPIQYPFLTGRLPPAYLRQVYSMADCFLQTARGEGFGIPIVEAMACGTPLIIPRNSAMHDFNGASPYYLEEQVPFASSSGTVQWVVNPHEICQKLLMVQKDNHRIDLGTKQMHQIEFAQQYEIGVVSKQLEAILQRSIAEHEDGVTLVEDKE